jgi:hypothetical protein
MQILENQGNFIKTTKLVNRCTKYSNSFKILGPVVISARFEGKNGICF